MEPARSTHWESFEIAYRLKFPACAVCGGTDCVQVHHVMPFDFCKRVGRDDLELDTRNLITLCNAAGKRHHLLIGHLGSFLSYNSDLFRDVAKMKNSSELMIRSDPDWKAEAASRPKTLARMEGQDFSLFRQHLDFCFPVK